MYASRNIVRVVKAMKMVSVGHVARMREKINTYESGYERGGFEHLGVDRRRVLSGIVN